MDLILVLSNKEQVDLKFNMYDAIFGNEMKRRKAQKE